MTDPPPSPRSLYFVYEQAPIAKERPRVVVRNGRSISFTPKRTADYEKALRAYATALAMRHGWHATGEDRFRIEMRFFRPDRRRVDADNCIKAFLDGLQGSAIFPDDYQVVEIHAYLAVDKASPRTECRIEKL